MFVGFAALADVKGCWAAVEANGVGVELREVFFVQGLASGQQNYKAENLRHFWSKFD